MPDTSQPDEIPSEPSSEVRLNSDEALAALRIRLLGNPRNTFNLVAGSGFRSNPPSMSQMYNMYNLHSRAHPSTEAYTTFQVPTFTPFEQPQVEDNTNMPGQLDTTNLGCSCPDCTYIAAAGNQDGELADWEAELLNPREYSTSETRSMRELLPTSYNPARQHRLPWISNGMYRIWVGDDTDTAVDINLHTVGSGALRGMRILRRRNTVGTLHGFASLQEDGSVWIWRSQIDLRGSAFHQVLNFAFMSLFSSTNQRLIINSRRSIPVPDNESINITLTGTTCNTCNTGLRTLVSMCRDHLGDLTQEQLLEENRFDSSIASTVSFTTGMRTPRPRSRPVRAAVVREPEAAPGPSRRLMQSAIITSEVR